MCELYPIFLRLRGRAVLIVGGGNLAVQKLATLAPTGARVTVAAPRLDERLGQWQGAGELTLLRRSYGPDLLDGAALAFAATDDPALNARVVEDATARGIPANAVDEPEHCAFYTPAVVRRGAFTLALSTSGRFPGLSGAVREALAAWLPEADDDLYEALFALRESLRADGTQEPARRAALRELVRRVRTDYLEPPLRREASASGAS